ncbi:MAG TPA: cysteine synthase family protein, partial [Mycobacteriales bacterium]|nr:cysteine synthase family protein [Mycobacteriales bacterium]
DCSGRLLAKAEMLQPGGSVKDRSALGCVEHGLATGALTAGQPVVEMTSGNMGMGLAVVCGVLAHPFTAYMSRGNSPQRAAMMRAVGAEVVLVDQVDGTPGRVTGTDIAAAEKHARDDAGARGAWYVDQFRNPGSVAAHQNGTAAEIWEQTGGEVDAFVACVGTGGTLIGVARGLKARKPSVAAIAVEPAGAAVLAGHAVTQAQHLLQGAGYGSVPPHWDPKLVDGFLQVNDDEASQCRKWLARRCGLHVGFTAGANVHAAISWLRDNGPATVVTVLCDGGWKYE